MSSVSIVEVKTRSQLRKFVDLPNKMYRDVPQFVPAFYGDDINDWNRKKNPAFKYCEARAFLAYRDGKIVGRIGAILSHKANETWNTKRMRFTQVDFIDDPEVSDRLFETVENWARQKGCDQVHGPLGFCDMDREGMLVEGFDRRSMFITYYNHQYYNEHLSRLGYEKDVDWVEYRIVVPEKGDPNYERFSRLSETVMRRYHLHKAQLRKRSEYRLYIKKIFELINIAYADLYGVVRLEEEQIEKYSDKFTPLVNPDYLCIVLDENDELAGFGVSCPSMAAALQRSAGRLLPSGWIGILKALRHNSVLDLLLIAVRPELQNKGVNAIVIDHIMKSCIKNGIEYAESGPQLERNTKVLGQWKAFEIYPHKRRRCYIKSL